METSERSVFKKGKRIMKSKKRYLILAGGLFIAVLLAAFAVAIFSQVIFPIATAPVDVQCTNWDATYTYLEKAAERYDTEELYDYEHACSFKGKLPSDNPWDYMDIYCSFSVKNSSFAERYSIDATLKNAENYADHILFFSDARAAYTTPLFSRQAVQAYIVLTVYSGDLSEEQLSELVNGLTVTVKANGHYFGARSKDVSFKKCENIEFHKTGIKPSVQTGETGE